MVAITSMNLIDVQAIVSNIMAVESLRGDRLAAQKSTQSAQIVALQELNTSMAAVGRPLEAITSAAQMGPTYHRRSLFLTLATLAKCRRIRARGLFQGLPRTHSPSLRLWVAGLQPRLSRTPKIVRQ